MKFFNGPRAGSFDRHRITETIDRALTAAGLDTTHGPMRHVTDTIRRALGSHRDSEAATPAPADAEIVDVDARVVSERPAPRPAAGDPSAARDIPGGREPVAEGEPAVGRGRTTERAPPIGREKPGTFVERRFTGAAGTRKYKLHVPSRASDSPPLMVMLHGCTQSADDFAAGTRMNRLADEHGFLVVYPEQPADANPSKCWNWFSPRDQVRDSGEPALIAGIVREVIARDGADARRVFVAGMSAGAAMAVVLGETYPELFAGVGAHSGLPYGSAHDIPSALAVMKGRGRGLPGISGPAKRKAAQAVPLIVFHGDRDHTVQHDNAEEIVEQALAAHVSESSLALEARVDSGTTGGRGYTRTAHVDADGRPRIESWVLHGAGHAWSGGDASGSHTDPKGPDASTQMVRFFLEQPRAGSA